MLRFDQSSELFLRIDFSEAEALENMILIENLNEVISMIQVQAFGVTQIALNYYSVSLRGHQNFKKWQSTCSST